MRSPKRHFLFFQGIFFIAWVLIGSSPLLQAQELNETSSQREETSQPAVLASAHPVLDARAETSDDVAVTVPAPENENDQDSASIILVETEGSEPAAAEVEALLQRDLSRIAVRIYTESLSQFPENISEWTTYTVEKSADTAGLLAVIGWRCVKRDDCRLVVVESRSLTVTTIPVGDIRGTTHETSVYPLPPTHIAAGIREILYGEYLFELPRVSQQVNHPKPSLGRSHRTGGDLQSSSDKSVRNVEYETFQPPILQSDRRLLWLDFAYLGAYPYPSSRTIHGIAPGVSFFVHRRLALSVRVGGLARRKNIGQLGTIHAYHLPITTGIQFPFTVGSALFSVGAIIQYDAIWARAETTRNETVDKYYSDFSFGGETLWRVPMPRKGLELFFGAGILATLFSEDYLIDDEKIIDRTKLQFYWLAGVSKNIFVD